MNDNALSIDHTETLRETYTPEDGPLAVTVLRNVVGVVSAGTADDTDRA